MSKEKIGIVGRMLIKATSYYTGINLPATQSSLNVLGNWLGMTPVYRHWNDRDYVNKAFLVNPMLYAIVNRITSKAATVPFAVYKVKNSQKAFKYRSLTGRDATKESIQQAMQFKSEAYELDDRHPLNDLLEKPNEWQRQTEFIQTCIGFKLLTGERFLYKTVLDMGANQGLPTSIVNLPPHCMVVIPGAGMFEIQGYELHINATPLPIPKELIIFSREWNPVIDNSRSHLRGLSPLRAGNKLLDRMEAAQDRATIMMQNAGAAGILFNKVVDQYTVDQRNELKRVMNTEILGRENTSTIHVGQGDLSYINFGMKASDMELLEQERFTNEQLCNLYKVPPGLFIAHANASDNNIKEWKKQLVSDAVIPALSDMREDYNEIAALYPDAPYVDYDLSYLPEMQEDVNITAARLEKMPYMTWNEKRLAVGMDEDTVEPMLARYIIPSGLQDISAIDPEKMNSEMDKVDEEFSLQETAKLNGQKVES